MKRKFEENVASDIPKTKLHEPELPWKLSEDDVGAIGSKDDEYKAAVAGTPPLKTRGLFLMLLVVAIFGISAYLVSSAVVDNEKMHDNIVKKEGELSAMRVRVEKVAAEKEEINKNFAALEKKLNDLTAQKQLFASVIESLTKRGEVDEAEAAPVAPNNASGVSTPQQ